MLSTSGLLTAGNAAVGISLPQGRYPASGLDPGDIVEVVRSVEGVGKVIADQAVVGTVQTPGSSVFGSSTSSDTVVTVIVDQEDASAVAAASMAEQVSLVLLRRGAPTGAADGPHRPRLGQGCHRRHHPDRRARGPQPGRGCR